ncbi:hypothetical protein N9S37_03655 [Gammaproteobacteria bacterium]|nr:hypothetical protein [Gammaproteobacteria bacterium]MDA9579504.1 hypothetical protein [Gammaproteobacteria bacterium]
MSLRKPVDEKCKDCIYDPTAAGTWRQQVFLCSANSCPLWRIRAKPTSPIPESTLRWYGVDLDQFQPLTATAEKE